MRPSGDNYLLTRIGRIILYIVLFGSGMSALIYQIIWIREFGLVFGVHVFSMATVLTAFMAGLALGAIYFGNLADKSSNPIRLFLFLELGIGLFAVLFPFTFQGLIKGYDIIASSVSPGPYSLQLIRFILSFIFLLIPTTLMGGTMPVIIKIFVENLGEIGGKISRLYAVNNLGAVTGGFLAGFVIIHLLGSNQSGYMAAAANIVNVGLVFLVVRLNINPSKHTDMLNKSIKPEGMKMPDERLPKSILTLVLWVFAIEGFTTLSYEIIWARILIDFSIEKTVYFSTVIVISFVSGLSLGSILVSRVLDKHRNLLAFLGINQILIGLLSVFLLLAFTWIAPEISVRRSMFGTWLHEAGREYLFFFLILLPPVILMGITYPLVSKLANSNIDQLGRKMGYLGFLDTIGSVAGSFIAGFILVPFLGVVKSFVIVVIVNLLLGSILIIFHPSIRQTVKSAVLALTCIFAGIMFWIMPKNPNTRTWWDKPENKPWFDPNQYTGIIFFDEGAAGTVTVRDYPDGLALNINGLNTAYATKKDLKVNRQLGYMPYLLHPNPKRGLVIGYGTGATLCSLNQNDMEQVDIAEICSGVIKASYVFEKWNRDAIHQPKVKLYNDDGRSVIFMANGKYDIITSNAIHPRLSNNIYTYDFYKLCYNKLNEDGIICQWTPENWLTNEEYKSLVKAFIDAFPHTTMWYLNEYSTLLIGTKKPLKVDIEKIVRKFSENETLRKDFEEFDMFSPYEFLGQFWMSEDDIKEYISGSKSNTDNYPIVEYSRVINKGPVPEVMEYLINFPTDYEKVLYNFGYVEKKEKELAMIKSYSISERQRMLSIMNVTKAYMKHVIK